MLKYQSHEEIYSYTDPWILLRDLPSDMGGQGMSFIRSYALDKVPIQEANEFLKAVRKTQEGGDVVWGMVEPGNAPNVNSLTWHLPKLGALVLNLSSGNLPDLNPDSLIIKYQVFPLPYRKETLAYNSTLVPSVTCFCKYSFYEDCIRLGDHPALIEKLSEIIEKSSDKFWLSIQTVFNDYFSSQT
jgi:hypothetical protein